jgi:hypothetical protein
MPTSSFGWLARFLICREGGAADSRPTLQKAFVSSSGASEGLGVIALSGVLGSAPSVVEPYWLGVGGWASVEVASASGPRRVTDAVADLEK